MKQLLMLIVALGFCCATVPAVRAQDQAAPQPTQPTAEELEKQKAEREKNAYRLLDQVIDEAQSLRLPENRVRVQINAADMLWDNNQPRARSLFATAGEGVAELGRNTQQTVNNLRGGPPQNNPDRRAFQLRQELVIAAARHDAALAYQLLASTKPPAQPAQNTPDPRNPRPQLSAEDSLEQMLLALIASIDPKLAAQNAEQMIDKGQFPRTLTDVLVKLQAQDHDAATKLADKTVKKLLATNLLTNNEAANLVQSLLFLGPRLPEGSPEPSNAPSTGKLPVLEQGTYVDLLGSAVDLALKATPTAQNNQRPQVQRVVGPQGMGPGVRPGQVPAQPTDAQLEQMGARRLLGVLQLLRPSIDKYLPAKAALLQQKSAEFGFGNSPMNMAQTFSVMQGNQTADALVQAAATAPPQVQSRLYQQAAYRALDEGNTDRARQIATEHLDATVRDRVMQRIDFREMAKKAESTRLDEIRQMIARVQSDDEKIDLLLQLSRDTEKVNPKLSLQLLEEAKQMTNRKATNYGHFEQQLKVAHAFVSVDPARSFDVLDPGISQLNELLAAAAVLSGFEVNTFRDGEMTLQGGGGLFSILNRYGEELALLARSDFDRADTLAGRFQFPEPRIMTRLAIVKGLLGVQ